jgi:hypothetical protein
MSAITPLYYANLFVDQVQDAKKKFVETFVFDDKVAAPLKQFVEAQRTFTKEVNRSAVEMSEYITTSSKATFEKMKKVA